MNDIVKRNGPPLPAMPPLSNPTSSGFLSRGRVDREAKMARSLHERQEAMTSYLSEYRRTVEAFIEAAKATSLLDNLDQIRENAKALASAERQLALVTADMKVIEAEASRDRAAAAARIARTNEPSAEAINDKQQDLAVEKARSASIAERLKTRREEEIAEVRHAAELHKARQEADRQRYSHYVFKSTLPLRHERVQRMYEKGVFDAEIERLEKEAQRDQRLGDITASSAPAEPPKPGLTLEEIDEQIEIARKTQAPSDYLQALFNIRALLSAKRENP